jgi:hypothetical protein
MPLSTKAIKDKQKAEDKAAGVLLELLSQLVEQKMLLPIQQLVPFIPPYSFQQQRL